MENRRRSSRPTRQEARGHLAPDHTAMPVLERHPASAEDIHAERARDPKTLPILPVLPVRNTVILPNMVVPLYVERESAVAAIQEGLDAGRNILVVAQRNQDEEDPGPDGVFEVGTECSVGRLLRMPDGTHSVLVQGQRRARIAGWVKVNPYGRARVQMFDEPRIKTPTTKALGRATLSLLERCTKLSTRLTEDAYVQALNIEQPGALADFVVAQLDASVDVRQQLLETIPAADRLRRACEMLTAELNVLELEHKIQDEVQREVDRGQREFYLREQLKVIQREIGEHDPGMRESVELRERVLARGMPAEVEARALKEVERLDSMPSAAPEFHVLRTYVDWLVSLPWRDRSDDRLDLAAALQVLDANHYGLARVKDRIIEQLAVRKLAPEGRAPILCLAGPPGVGKTSLGRSIADALGRAFVRVSLGGVRDEAEIRGHRRTYVGALPGRILQTIKTGGTINPVFVLDEIDKLASDFRGDPTAALLEVLDPEQNHGFSDHYLEVPYDLSQVFFVLTANVVSAIPGPLRDRMEIIELPGYTEEEKVHIARSYLIPRQMRECGLTAARVEIDDGAIRRIIREYTFEAGVRGIEREIGAVMRKVARRVAEGRRHKSTVSEPRVAAYLGPQRYYPGEAEDGDEAGVATGLAWTAAGGDLTPVEVMAVAGHGSLMLTGQLGDVMKESAQAALTFTRARADVLGLPSGFHERLDLHVHLPSGSIPKDGPSAGITMATAMISALTGRRVRRDVAMTGEITLRGRVLPVGGIKEKVLAAHRAGLAAVVLPRRNLRDLEDVPADVLEALRVIPVATMDEVLAATLDSDSGPDIGLLPPAMPARLPHPPLQIADPITSPSRVARPRARRVVAVTP